MPTIAADKDAKLLTFVYQNSAMGVQTITQLLDIVEDEKLLQHLKYELRKYNEFHSEARDRLNSYGYDDKGLSSMEKLKTYLMIGAQTLTDKSASHIAEMLITGSNMGILDAEKNLKHNPDTEKDIKTLMEKLKSFEEDNVQKLKAFL